MSEILVNVSLDFDDVAKCIVFKKLSFLSFVDNCKSDVCVLNHCKFDGVFQFGPDHFPLLVPFCVLV